jgi:hypothetical protein
LATNAATAVAAGILSVQRDTYVIPTESDAVLITICAYSIFAICAALVLFGGKVYTMLQVTITFMVIWIFSYLLFVDIFMASGRSWGLVLTGFVNFGYFPSGETLDWSLIAGFAAFAGTGGLGNAAISNYIRDKGWGMGSLVGAIPSAVGGKEISLSHLGMVFPVTQENIQKFQEWWKYILFDQAVIWGGGAMLGIALPAILAIEFIDPSLHLGQWQAAAFQAEGIAKRHGSIFWYLTLICGFWVLFSSQLRKSVWAVIIHMLSLGGEAPQALVAFSKAVLVRLAHQFGLGYATLLSAIQAIVQDDSAFSHSQLRQAVEILSKALPREQVTAEQNKIPQAGDPKVSTGGLEPWLGLRAVLREMARQLPAQNGTPVLAALTQLERTTPDRESLSEFLSLLQVALEQHPMSVEGFRGTFLLRQGVRSSRDGAWLLRVERETYDVVLDRFPWSTEWVRLPWMETMLRVEW